MASKLKFCIQFFILLFVVRIYCAEQLELSALHKLELQNIIIKNEKLLRYDVMMTERERIDWKMLSLFEKLKGNGESFKAAKGFYIICMAGFCSGFSGSLKTNSGPSKVLLIKNIKDFLIGAGIISSIYATYLTYLFYKNVLRAPHKFNTHSTDTRVQDLVNNYKTIKEAKKYKLNNNFVASTDVQEYAQKALFAMNEISEKIGNEHLKNEDLKNDLIIYHKADQRFFASNSGAIAYANGNFYPGEIVFKKEIVSIKKASWLQKATVIHEVAHHFLGHTSYRSSISTEQKEFEAETLTIKILYHMQEKEVLKKYLLKGCLSDFFFSSTKNMGILKYRYGIINGFLSLSKETRAEICQSSSFFFRKILIFIDQKMSAFESFFEMNAWLKENKKLNYRSKLSILIQKY